MAKYGLTKESDDIFNCENCNQEYHVQVEIEIVDCDFSMEDNRVQLEDCTVKFEIVSEMRQQEKMTDLKK